MSNSKESAPSRDVDERDEDDGGPCKWGPVQPLCCQRFRTPKWVLFWLCCVIAIQGIVVTGLVNVIITTIEKRFGLSSTESATITSCYDIASAICLLPVGYFGGQGVRPRYIGIGVLTVGIGSLVFALPHFTTDLYTVDISQDNLCRNGENSTSLCNGTVLGDSLSDYKYVFIIAMLLIGVGASPFYTLGVTYIDDSLPKRLSPLYVGIFYATAVFGTAVGYLGGGESLNIWTDFESVDTSSLTITTDNRRWVGAWWLGFVIAGAAGILLSIPVSGFPGTLPGTSKHRKEKEAGVYAKVENDAKSDSNSTRDTKDIKTDNSTSRKDVVPVPEKDGPETFSLNKAWNSTKVLLMNPTFMFINLVAAAEAMIIGGFSTFTPKFLEAQFSQPAARAAQYVGYASISAGAGGTVLGGYLMKRFNPRVNTMLKLCVLSCTCVVLLFLIFLTSCENVPFAGINVEYNRSLSNEAFGFLGKELDAQCNTNCGCTEEDFRPVCGRDGVMYFSPCYAGCESLYQGSTTRYSNCSCITSDVKDYMAEFTSCESPCIWLAPFLIVFAVAMLFTFTISIPVVAITLRCVPGSDRSYALGIQFLLLRVLGSIPGPIIFGKMIDLSCLLWQKRCDGDGSCFFYDNRKLSYYLMALGIVIKSLSGIFFFLALIFYKAPVQLNQVQDIDVSKPVTSDGFISSSTDDSTAVLGLQKPAAVSGIRNLSYENQSETNEVPKPANATETTTVTYAM